MNMRTDFYSTNYGLSENSWKWICEQNAKQLKDFPICQICNNSLSTGITGLGRPFACCESCNNNIYKQIEESNQDESDYSR